ncbi:hybrid sensor histidine kinase/response regulator [Halobellus ordinarius]|uniref:hybrid sensor histidine kinase/response regulator n=1 Tax=Halobellus ordinarius TaxID=3075120 RepID=UPI0028802F1C|nr:response regulator [Halobellus sp. ZY16]
MAEAIRVLHVDDDSSVGELTATLLEREDERIEVQTAASTDEGLAIAAERSIDCIVSDYEMPGRSGLDFLEAVREDQPDLPFILYTGKGSEEVASDAISAGVTDYLQKGVGADQYALLANRIRNAVEGHRDSQRVTEQLRINRVVRRINRALVRATTQQEIDERVCEIISGAEPYRFAWIGDHNPDARTVERRTAAGVGEDYPDVIEITTDEAATARGPTGEAVRTRELSVMQDIHEDPDYEPWREEALERGYRASAAVPLIHDDILYGVLNVYADRTHVFDDHERQLLSTLGATIGHAYHRIELQQQYTDQYRVLFEEAPVMVVFTRSVDGEPIIDDCNRSFAERLGYERAELRGTPLARYYTEESTNRLLEKGYQRALTGEFVREQRTLLTRNDEEILTILRASPRRNPEGEIVGTHALFLDITNEQQVTELKRKNERLDEFTSVVSHDLRNPLNVAQGHLELVRETYDDDHLDVVASAHDRMEALIDDLLRLARASEAATETDVVDLKSLLNGCWGNVDTADATLDIDIDRAVDGDETRLKQVFENVFRNSIDHGRADVTVTVGELDDGFYIEDDGPGIPASDRDNIFDAGFSTSPDGTGFGLSIVKQVIEAHGWAIDVTDGTEGGARFEITDVAFADE